MAKENGRTTVTLRLPKDLIARIDELRAEQPVTIPRNTWIAEAVVRRVEKELTGKEKDNVAQ